MIIATANQKGGVSKTTTCAALACALHNAGKRVLAVDMDPQCSLSFILGADTNAPGVLDLLQGGSLPELVQHTEQCDIIAGSKLLAATAGKIQPGALQNALTPAWHRYRYIVIDTPPGLTNALLLALVAADIVVIPVTADAGSLLGLRDLRDTIATAQKYLPFKKEVRALLTQANTRKTNAEKAIEEALRTTCAELEIPFYRQEIRRADAVRASAGFRESIVNYDPKSKPAQDYIALLSEMKLK